MPVYQYACTECGDQLEVRQSFTDDALTKCPSCAGRLRKVLTAVGVVFKGSGFYRNDSRSSPAGEDGGGDKADKPESAAATEGSSPKEPVAAGTASSTSGSGGGSSSSGESGGAKAASSAAPASSTGEAGAKSTT